MTIDINLKYPERVRVRFYSDNFDKDRIDFINEFLRKLSVVYKTKLLYDHYTAYEITITNK